MNLRNLTAVLLILCAAAPAFAAETPEPVVAGAGKVKFDGLLQAWTVNDTSSLASSKLNFRMRRAEIKFSGSVAENTRWFVMLDPAKSLTLNTSGTGLSPTNATLSSANDNKVLQDLGVAFSPFPGFELIVGQFKIPTTAEGLDPSAELLFPERSMVARAYGDKREPGAMLTYQFAELPLKLSTMFSNGQLTNVNDTNSVKDFNFRVDAPLNDHLKLGAFTTAADMSYQDKRRFGMNARGVYEGLTLRAEGVHAYDFGVNTNGVTTDAAYAVTEAFQPIARWETLNNGIFGGTAYTFGANYYVSKHNSKIQATYSVLDNVSGNVTGSSGTYTAVNNSNGGMLLISFQAAI